MTYRPATFQTEQASSQGSPPDEALARSLKELADIKYALDESAIVAITDASGVITYVNDTFCQISKYSRDELLGQTHRLINSGYHSKGFFEELWKIIAAGKVWKGEVCNRAKDQTLYWVDTTIVPFLDAQGKPYQYIAIRKDITYLKRIESELRLLNDELEKRVTQRTGELEKSNQELSQTLTQLKESESMRETFVSALTHDLRTPLVAEQRALELFQLQQDKLPPKLAPLAERLVKNNEELLEMVNKLLETYQYEAGKIRLLTESVSLHWLLSECIDKLSGLAENKQIQVENLIPVDIPTIPADPDQLRRVFVNLIGNAIENIQPGGHITVSATDKNTAVEIKVSDNGPGIPPDVLPNLFDRYFVMQQTRKKIGSGLGLSICKMITKLHGGTIDVISEPGAGTVFTLQLPKQQEVNL